MEETVVRHIGRDDAARLAALISTAELQKSLRRPRSLFSYMMNVLTATLTFVALVPLFSVVYMLVVAGMHAMNFAVFTSLPPGPNEAGGGFGNAILGTLLMVGIAAVISVPFGILAAVYLAEIGPDSKLAQFVRFGAKILSGFPSVLAGVVAYGAVVLLTGSASAWAGGIALSLLMLPTVILTAEDAIRMVPPKIREAAIGMGATSTQTIWHVMLPTALPGILTGVMLAVARAAGETAPLLFTAKFSGFWPIRDNSLSEPTASLAVLIYNFSHSASKNQREMAWAAALVLVFLVLTINLIGQSLSRRRI
jgi:phosphate transport system permease protein